MNRMLHHFLLFKNKNLNSLSLKTAFTILALVTCFGQAMAQKPARTATKPKPAAEMKRCGTMEGIEEMMRNDPEFRARIEQNEREYQQWLETPEAQRPNSPSSPNALPGPVIIPVVVHVVLPNPWIITDESIDYMIGRLNEDFSGTNADSTNCSFGGFCDRRGHSLLRFTRAKRDQQGNFTTGIVRKVGTTLITGGNQPLKNSNTATGGSTGWDVSKYYNIYIGDGGPAGLLGISPGIGPGSSVLGSGGQDGVCVDYRAFANLCFSYPEYTFSRTMVHEIGHNFGLYHIWGDGNTCTNGADFRQLSSAGCTLPANLLGTNDDTPNQSGPTQGCPGTTISNGCANPVAKMFQNYMDYTDDGCYSMFTNGQANRMHHVLEFCRAGYLTTLGGQYPSIYPLTLDAMAHSVVSPGGAEVIASGECDTEGVIYPDQTCEGTFVPKLRIYNGGTSVITSLTVTTTINGSNPRTQTISVNIPLNRSKVVTLDPQTAVPGVNRLKFELSEPNAGVDGNSANDTITYVFSVATPIALPYVENFTSAVFPPANGSINQNPDGPPPATPDGTGIGWARTTIAGRPLPASMFINLYNYTEVGERDLYKLPPVSTSTIDSLNISFYYSYRQYFGTDVETAPNDSLKLLYSSDCGVTWLPLFSKGGADLATVSTPTDSNYRPFNNAQWRKESFTFTDLCGSGVKNVLFAFESYNDFGNNIFVDSISVVGYNSANLNARVVDIIQPGEAFCSTSLTPVALIGNAGRDTLRSVTVGYSIDGGPVATFNWTGVLAKCETATVTLPAATVSYAPHSIRVFTSNPNAGTDDIPSNDTLSQDFTVFNTAESPVREDFNGTTFPPANWGIINSTGGGTTWERRIPVPANLGEGALLMNNPNSINRNNAVDYFVSPVVINSAFVDSVLVYFDLAYRPGSNYPGSTVLPLDTLELLATTDCGITFTSVWKKWGDALQTVDDPNYTSGTQYIPRANEWKNQRAYISPFVGASNFQLYWAMKGNKQNNLWIDNINILAERLPQRLRDQGYLIYPNPSTGTFRIHHSAVEPPVDLQSVQVYNSAGQLVWSKAYNGNADRQINVNLSNVANGLYVLKMIYTNRTVVEKIVKTQ